MIPVVHSVKLMNLLKDEVMAALTDFITEPDDNSPTQHKLECPVNVFLYDMPATNASPNPLLSPNYPAVVIQPSPDFGKTLEAESNLYHRNITIDLMIYTISQDVQSRVEFNLNILTRLEQHFSVKDIIGSAFSLKLPITWQSSDQTQKPHYVTCLTLTYEYQSAWRETNYDS